MWAWLTGVSANHIVGPDDQSGRDSELRRLNILKLKSLLLNAASGCGCVAVVVDDAWRPTGYKNMLKKKTNSWGGGYTSRAKVLNQCCFWLVSRSSRFLHHFLFRAGGRNTYKQAASFLRLNQTWVALKTVDSCSFALSVCRPPRCSSCVPSVLGSPSVTEVRNKLPSCRLSDRVAFLGLLLWGGGGRGCTLRLHNLVSDQVFWVGLRSENTSEG